MNYETISSTCVDISRISCNCSRITRLLGVFSVIRRMRGHESLTRVCLHYYYYLVYSYYFYNNYNYLVYFNRVLFYYYLVLSSLLPILLTLGLLEVSLGSLLLIYSTCLVNIHSIGIGVCGGDCKGDILRLQ